LPPDEVDPEGGRGGSPSDDEAGHMRGFACGRTWCLPPTQYCYIFEGTSGGKVGFATCNILPSACDRPTCGCITESVIFCDGPSCTQQDDEVTVSCNGS
jgi:hypothetical protein